MRSSGNFNSEWGYLAPAPSFMRTARVVLVATAIGAIAGAAVVVSLIDRSGQDTDRMASHMASGTAHAIVTSAQAAPNPAAPPTQATSVAATAPVAINTTAIGAASSPVPARAQPAAAAAPPAAPVQSAAIAPLLAAAPPVRPAAVEPPLPATPQVSSTVVEPPQPAAVQPAQSAALTARPASAAPVADDGHARDEAVTPEAKPAPALAALSQAPPPAAAATTDTPEQALIPPQTVPPEKKTRHHTSYASNERYRPLPSLGTVLKRLFTPPHAGNSYYPNR